MAIDAVGELTSKENFAGVACVAPAGPSGTMCFHAPLPSRTAKYFGTRSARQKFQVMLPVEGNDTRTVTGTV